MQLYFVLSLIASILVVIFAVTNASAVPVKIFFLEYTLSLSLIIFISTALGAIIATMIGLVKQFKLVKQVKKLTSENQTLLSTQKKLEDQIAILNLSQSTTELPEESIQITEPEA